MTRKSNIVAVISPKGGVGKTVTTANLAAALSNEFNRRVLVVDTNVSTASLGLHFDIFYPKKTIHDAIGKNSNIKKAIHQYDKNLHVLPASIKVRKHEKNVHEIRKNIFKIVNSYEKLLKGLSKDYDVVLLDCSPGFDLETIAALHVASGLLIVTNPDYPSIVTAAKAIEYAQRAKVPLGGIVLNKVQGKGYEIKKEEIEHALGVKVLQEIPFDKKVIKSIAHRKPIVLFRPFNKSSRAYKKLAGMLIGEKPSHWLKTLFKAKRKSKT